MTKALASTVMGLVLLAPSAKAQSMVVENRPASPVTEGALSQLCSEKERVVVVLSAKNVWVAVRAASVTQIEGGTLVIGAPADSILVENKVRSRGAERPPTKEDVLEVVTHWYPPFDGKTISWFLEGGKASKLEYIQFTKGQTLKDLRIDVQTILTWFCPEPGLGCHEPKVRD
jgi:hypothetical protein